MFVDKFDQEVLCIMKTKYGTLLVFCIILAMVMATGCAARNSAPPSAGSVADTAYDGKWPSYVNLGTGDDYLPVIKEGMGSDIVVTLAINQPSNGGDWDDLWISKFYEKYLNINFSVEQIPDAAINERKSLMFASNDLPDIMMNLNFTANEIYKYGQMEGQLLDLSGYLDDDLTPYIIDTFIDNPGAKTLSTTPDGKMYTLPVAAVDAIGRLQYIQVDTRRLDASGIEIPNTLDGFIDMLRKFKEADATGDVIPMGGRAFAADFRYYILNALGYIGGENGYTPGLRNAEAELPAVNRELFLQYLTVLTAIYSEGLISDDFFMPDQGNVAVTAEMLDNRVCAIPGGIYQFGYEDWANWKCLVPLTSEWHDTPEWREAPAATIGGFVMSSDTKYPEVGMRFADAYFSVWARIMWTGPRPDDEELLMGYSGPGLHWDHETNNIAIDESIYPEGINDLWSYLMMKHTPMPQFGMVDGYKVSIEYQKRFLLGNPPEVMVYSPDNPDGWSRIIITEAYTPYLVTRFPNIYYVDDDTLIEMTDLNTVIKPYVDEQTALFVTGRRPLSDIDAFLSELKAINIDKLDEIYKNIWAGYGKN